MAHDTKDETRVLARYAAGMRYEDIPTAVRNSAVDLLIDQIGVQIGCSELPWAQQVRSTWGRPGGAGEASVVRYGDRLPVMAAAFVNAVFGHSFEYDDANPLVHGHLGAELIPPLLAYAERGHISGREFLTALVAGYEVRGRVGWAVSPDMLENGGPQYSTTCGPFGVAAALGRLHGSDAELVRNAMGVAGTYSGGLMQYDHGGGSVKRLFAAVGASGGMQAFELAQAGITGPEGILEGARGLLRIYPDEYRPERLIVDLGSKWTIDYLLFKPYCCCAIIHPAIDAMQHVLAQSKVKPEGIGKIVVAYPKASVDHSSITDPKDLLGMQFSTSFSLAITTLKGRNTPREYTHETMRDPKIRAVADKVSLVEDGQLDQLFEDGHMAAKVTLECTDGRRFEKLVQDAKGSRAVKFTKEDVEEKFNSQVVDVFGASRSAQILETLRNIEKQPDMAEVARLLVVPAKG